MNPSDQLNMGELDARQRGQNNATPATSQDSALISYQPSQTPIDFTEFLNLEDNQVPLNEAGSLDDEK